MRGQQQSPMDWHEKGALHPRQERLQFPSDRRPETADMERFSSLGVITGKEIPNQVKVKKLFVDLNEAFAKEETTKEEVIQIMKEYLPNFEHIETGKSLDSKM